MSEIVRHILGFCIGGAIGWAIAEIIQTLYYGIRRKNHE
jgi:hypothetical protein